MRRRQVNSSFMSNCVVLKPTAERVEEQDRPTPTPVAKKKSDELLQHHCAHVHNLKVRRIRKARGFSQQVILMLCSTSSKQRQHGCQLHDGQQLECLFSRSIIWYESFCRLWICNPGKGETGLPRIKLKATPAGNWKLKRPTPI